MNVKKTANKVKKKVSKAVKKSKDSDLAKKIAKREKLVLAKSLEDLALKLKKEARKNKNAF